MLKLYGHAFSRAHRNLWMLKELGVPFEHEPTDFIHGGTRTPEYLRVNPNGRVPALVDGDLVLFESLAINLYLARKFGGPLAATSAVEDALATQWSFWVANEIERTLLLAAANLFLFPPPDRRPAEAALAIGKLGRPLRVLDAHLADSAFLLGDRFTVADLNVCAVMTLGPIAGVDFAEYRHVKPWLDANLERPAAADWKPIRFVVPRPPDDKLLAMFV